MTDHYVTSTGSYVGGYDDGAVPEESGLINLGDSPPDYSDQIWQFPGWSESPSRLEAVESGWREQQMPLAQQTVTALTYGEDGISGTVIEWQKYWLALRKWTADNPDFPDITKRPIQPS